MSAQGDYIGDYTATCQNESGTSEASAEFTVTAAARTNIPDAETTTTPTPPDKTQIAATDVFTLVGIFNASRQPGDCVYPITRSGTLQITVNLNAGTAEGLLTGGSSGLGVAYVCQGYHFTADWSESFDGTFSGTVDHSTGALLLAGTINNVAGHTMTIWGPWEWKDTVPTIRKDYPIAPGSSPLTMIGVVDITNRTGNGTLKIEAGDPSYWFVGDWQASAGALPSP